MSRTLFWISLVICCIAILLGRVENIERFGIEEEPARIAYYGGLGILSGFAGVIAALSGVIWLWSRSRRASAGQRRVLWALLGLLFALFAWATYRRIGGI